MFTRYAIPMSVFVPSYPLLSSIHNITQINVLIPVTYVGANSRASKSWVDSMVKQVLTNLHRGVPLSEAGGMSNGMVRAVLPYL